MKEIQYKFKNKQIKFHFEEHNPIYESHKIERISPSVAYKNWAQSWRSHINQ